MNIETIKTKYKKIIIFDTEYTTWEGAHARKWSGAGEHRELVQLAAALVDIEGKEIEDTFSVLVKPRINKKLSEYFINLTGITQEDVDQNGVDFAVAYQDFLAWAGDLPCFSYSNPKKLTADGAILIENIALYDEPLIFKPAQFKNILPIFFAAGIPTENYNSGKLYQHFGLKLEGHEHNAMHDVMSLSHSLFALY